LEAYRVGIAGATGLVGQRLVSRLASHPWFRIGALGASERSAGKPYHQAVRWLLDTPVPAAAASLQVGACTPATFSGCDLVLSALDTEVAREVEPALARAGLAVVSNSSAFRMAEDVPLVVPEVNGSHVAAIAGRSRSGYIVTNPNCSVTGLALVLAPLHAAFGVERAVVATLQSVSGAGLDGPRALDLIDNAVPFIGGEEEKMEAEIGKLLGRATSAGFTPASVVLAAHCHRVGVLEGHLEAASIGLSRPASPEAVVEALRGFRGETEGLGLPSAPAVPLVVREERDRPQPRLDRDEGDGMSVVVGRVRRCPVLTIRLVLLSHNMVRGAAGGALLNAELLAAKGLLPRRPAA